MVHEIVLVASCDEYVEGCSQVRAEGVESLVKVSIQAATAQYVDQLHYRDMYDSPACWKTVSQVTAELKKLKSDTAKREKLNDQIRIYVLGLGWEDCHHAWSKGGIDYTWKELPA